MRPRPSVAIPGENFRRQRRGSGSGEAHGIEPELAEDLSLDDAAEDGDAKQAVEFALRNFFEHTLAEAQIEARNGEKERGTGALEVGEEAFLPGGEVDGAADVQAGGFDDAALRDMCQRKIRDKRARCCPYSTSLAMLSPMCGKTEKRCMTPLGWPVVPEV